MYNSGINPYSYLYHCFKSRLRWDLRKEARQSKKKLRAIKGSMKGQSTVIMCNGPSLNDTNFDGLADSGKYVFGLNKINLLFDRTRLRPDAIVCVNKHVLQQNAEFYNETEIPLFLAHRCCKYKQDSIKMRENISYIYEFDVMRWPVPDVSLSILIGATVTTAAIQIALHMGFEKIALIGCDHSFEAKGKPHETVKSGSQDPNHFDPRYFSGGVKWDLPDLSESELYYERVDRLAESMGRKVYNCTSGGKLEIFERMDFEKFLKEF